MWELGRRLSIFVDSARRGLLFSGRLIDRLLLAMRLVLRLRFALGLVLRLLLDTLALG
jgi:hypothetical protein